MRPFEAVGFSGGRYDAEETARRPRQISDDDGRRLRRILCCQRIRALWRKIHPRLYAQHHGQPGLPSSHSAHCEFSPASLPTITTPAFMQSPLSSPTSRFAAFTGTSHCLPPIAFSFKEKTNNILSHFVSFLLPRLSICYFLPFLLSVLFQHPAVDILMIRQRAVLIYVTSGLILSLTCFVAAVDATLVLCCCYITCWEDAE